MRPAARVGSGLLAWTVVIAGALSILGFAPAAGATEVGINVAATSGNPLATPAVISAIRASRPAWVRLFIGWNAIEPAQGRYNTAEIADYQRFLNELPAGTRVDLDVEGTPAWAAGGSTDPRTPPADDAAFAGVLNYLENAFGSRVNAWEIWNEEDSSGWWGGTAAQYAGLLRAAYAAIKAASPAATVLIGGLTGNDAAYLDQLYAAGAEGSFDAVAVHTDTACNFSSPYVFELNRGTRTINQYFFLGFTAVHAAMVAAGDGVKPIFMTEVGWSSTTATCETGAWAGQKLAGVGPQTQAVYMQQAYHCLSLPRYSYVKAAMWFELVDDGSSTAPLDNYGLLTSGYARKPAFAAFQQESLSGDPLTGPCGAAARKRSHAGAGRSARPRITVSAPAVALRRSGTLDVAVTASAPASGVQGITIELSRRRHVRFSVRGFPRTVSCGFVLRRALLGHRGRHRIRVVVTDRRGHVASTTVRVVRARRGWGRAARTASAHPGRCRRAIMRGRRRLHAPAGSAGRGWPGSVRPPARPATPAGARPRRPPRRSAPRP